MMESVRCSSVAILSQSDRLSFRTGHDGYNIALQVYGSKQPGSEVLSWIGCSTPFSRFLRLERTKPKKERHRPGPEEASRLEKLPCELIDTFDPVVIRDSIGWLREWVLTHEDRSVERLWLDHRRDKAFDRRECAEQVLADFTNVMDFAGRSIARGERVLCTIHN